MGAVKGRTKREQMKKGAHVRLNRNDFMGDAKLAPVMHSGFKNDPEEAQKILDELRNSDFYNVVWRNAADLVGDLGDLGVDPDEGWEALDYDVNIEVPVAIKRKDGQRLDQEDHDNFHQITKAVQNASTLQNVGLSYIGTTNSGAVARFTPTFM